MSKTHKDVKQMDTIKAKRQARKVAVRFKTERTRKDDKRFYAFSTYIMHTAQED